MLEPAPTSRLAPAIARGILLEHRPATATTPELVVLGFHNTNYRVHLRPIGPIEAEIGKRILGTIRAEAKRVDVCETGGRYVEPVYGRPRRVQGTVAETDAAANTITVNAGLPLLCRLADARNQATQFEPGDVVTFDVMPGATFEQQSR